jgi:hypothetical protein
VPGGTSSTSPTSGGTQAGSYSTSGGLPSSVSSGVSAAAAGSAPPASLVGDRYATPASSTSMGSAGGAGSSLNQ